MWSAPPDAMEKWRAQTDPRELAQRGCGRGTPGGAGGRPWVERGETLGGAGRGDPGRGRRETPGGAGGRLQAQGQVTPPSGHKSPRASLPSAASWEFALHPRCVACGQQQGLISTWVIVFVPILGVAVPCGARWEGVSSRQRKEQQQSPQAGQGETGVRTECGRALTKHTHHLPPVPAARVGHCLSRGG